MRVKSRRITRARSRRRITFAVNDIKQCRRLNINRRAQSVRRANVKMTIAPGGNAQRRVNSRAVVHRQDSCGRVRFKVQHITRGNRQGRRAEVGVAVRRARFYARMQNREIIAQHPQRADIAGQVVIRIIQKRAAVHCRRRNIQKLAARAHARINQRKRHFRNVKIRMRNYHRADSRRPRLIDEVLPVLRKFQTRLRQHARDGRRERLSQSPPRPVPHQCFGVNSHRRRDVFGNRRLIDGNRQAAAVAPNHPRRLLGKITQTVSVRQHAAARTCHGNLTRQLSALQHRHRRRD